MTQQHEILKKGLERIFAINCFHWSKCQQAGNKNKNLSQALGYTHQEVEWRREQGGRERGGAIKGVYQLLSYRFYWVLERLQNTFEGLISQNSFPLNFSFSRREESRLAFQVLAQVRQKLLPLVNFPPYISLLNSWCSTLWTRRRLGFRCTKSMRGKDFAPSRQTD